MKFCENCNCSYGDEEAACKKCNKSLVSVESKEEATALSRKAHKADEKQYNIIQNAMCFVVLGSISLITGIIFIFLSFKKVRNKFAGLDFMSLQFYICIICLLVGIGLLSYGLFKAIKSYKARKQIKKTISDLNFLKTKE